MRTIIFDCNYPRRVAILEDENLVEYYEEDVDKNSLVGNIYRGKVTAIHKGIQAAFVDIGAPKNAFLFWEDVIPRYSDFPSKMIQDNLTIGQEVTVQVTNDAHDNKGPRCSMKVTIPGSYVVLALDSDIVAISKKVEMLIDRERFKKIANFFKTQIDVRCGIIFRTEAQNVSDSAIIEELKKLYDKMFEIMSAETKGRVPRCLLGQNDFIEKMCREKLTSEVSKVVINDEFTYNNLNRERIYYDRLGNLNINLYTLPYDIFSFYKISRQIESIHSRRILLDCGASIVFDKTEAMTVVDVNSGAYVGGKNLEENIFKVNVEAALEIARQIRLRDIGGIIVIDFLNMSSEEDNALLVQTFKNAFIGDKAKNYIGNISKLGLLEMTRKRTVSK